MENIADSLAQVTQTFEQLQHAIEQFNKRLLSESGNIKLQVSSPLTNQSQRHEVAAVLEQNFYLDDQEPRGVILLPGVVQGTATLLELANELNNAKLAFKQAVLDLKEDGVRIADARVQSHFIKTINRHPVTQAALKRTGLTRLHLKQCYRLLTVVDKVPDSVRYTWARTKAITKIDKAEAEKRLRRVGKDAGIERQIAKLSQISDHEHLGIVQQLQPHLRANIVCGDDRFMVSASLPIICPDNGEIEKLKLPGQLEACTRVVRADTRLEERPFLPAIRAYRYKDR